VYKKPEPLIITIQRDGIAVSAELPFDKPFDEVVDVLKGLFKAHGYPDALVNDYLGLTHSNLYNMENLNDTNETSDNAEKELCISDVRESDLFTAEYRGKKIKIKGKFLKKGEEMDLLQKLKKFNLGSGHEETKLSKIDDDNFVFRLETYNGGPVQTIHFERKKN
jgi:hypothetical protein